MVASIAGRRIYLWRAVDSEGEILGLLKLTKRRLKRSAFRSLVDLQAAIKRFLAETNDNPKPFVWTADPNKIIAAVKRGHQVLESLH